MKFVQQVTDTAISQCFCSDKNNIGNDSKNENKNVHCSSAQFREDYWV